jgi:HNH endonuclease
MARTMLCPYCGKEKDATKFTDEHVLPRALGGAVEPTNPFKLPVCGNCNTIAGLYIDGPVVRSWWLRVSRGGVRFNAMDPRGPPIPIQFMGRLDEWIDSETVCDYWLGPSGDSIFHFHRPYPGEATLVGGAPGAKPADLDPGFVFIGVVATNPVWHPVIRRSVLETFDRSPIHVINSAPPSQVPPQFARHLSWIESLPLEKKAKVALDMQCGERFTAKLALGMASIFLGEEYQMSKDAATLRGYMRSRDPVERASLELRGKALLSVPREDAKQLASTFGWRQCHTLALMPLGETLTFIAVLYGSHPMMVSVASDASLWRSRVRDGGLAWVVSSGTRTFAGPASAPAMLVDIAEEEPSGPLLELHQQLRAIPDLPPFHLVNG